MGKKKSDKKRNWLNLACLIAPAFVAGFFAGSALVHFSRKGPEKQEVMKVEKAPLETVLDQIQRDPDNEQLYNNLGCIHMKKKDYGAAESAFKKALELAPGYDMALSNMMNLRFRQKRFEEAIGFLKKYKSMLDSGYDKDLKKIYLYYARHLLSQDMLQAAESRIDDYFALEPRGVEFAAGADVLVNISTAYFRKQEYEECIRTSERLVGVIPKKYKIERAKVFSNMGMAYACMAEQKKQGSYLIRAKVYFDKASELDPDSDKIKNIISKYEEALQLARADSRKN